MNSVKQIRTNFRGPAKAGIVVLKQCDDLWLCLVLHARGEWALPKGFIEAGESSLNAAKREVEEETSLTQLDFLWGDVFIDTSPTRGHEIARYYLATSHMPVSLPVSADWDSRSTMNFVG